MTSTLGRGLPKCRCGQGGCVNLVLRIWPKCRQEGGRPKSQKLCRRHCSMAPYLGHLCQFVTLPWPLYYHYESGMYAFLFLLSFLFKPCALSVKSFIFPIKIKPRQWALSIPSSQRNLQRPRECSASEHCKLLSDLRPTRALLEGATYCSINLISPSLSSVSILEP